MKDKDIIICRCEEITKGEIIQAIRDGATTVDGIKRMTRAGKGLCQGRTCRPLVEAILMPAVLALGMMAAIWLMGGIV